MAASGITPPTLTDIHQIFTNVPCGWFHLPCQHGAGRAPGHAVRLAAAGGPGGAAGRRDERLRDQADAPKRCGIYPGRHDRPTACRAIPHPEPHVHQPLLSLLSSFPPQPRAVYIG
eukprot:scaffold108642_cov29-Phaeocystis_antarctica.AAC.2